MEMTHFYTRNNLGKVIIFSSSALSVIVLERTSQNSPDQYYSLFQILTTPVGLCNTFTNQPALFARQAWESAISCFWPGWCSTLKSYSDKISSHLATCLFGSSKCVSQQSALWSVLAKNQQPHKYGLKCCTAYMKVSTVLSFSSGKYPTCINHHAPVTEQHQCHSDLHQCPRWILHQNKEMKIFGVMLVFLLA